MTDHTPKRNLVKERQILINLDWPHPKKNWVGDKGKRANYKGWPWPYLGIPSGSWPLSSDLPQQQLSQFYDLALFILYMFLSEIWLLEKNCRKTSWFRCRNLIGTKGNWGLSELCVRFTVSRSIRQRINGNNIISEHTGQDSHAVGHEFLMYLIPKTLIKNKIKIKRTMINLVKYLFDVCHFLHHKTWHLRYLCAKSLILNVNKYGGFEHLFQWVRKITNFRTWLQNNILSLFHYPLEGYAQFYSNKNSNCKTYKKN